MKNENSITQFSRVAVVRTDRLGDMVLTLPMLRAIRNCFKGAELSLITRKYVKPLLYKQDFIDKVHYLENSHYDIQAIFNSQKFDVVFFPRPRFQEVFPAFREQIPHRVGTFYRWYSLLFTHRIKEHRKTAEFNEAEYNIHMVNSFCGTNYSLKYVTIHPEPGAINKVKELLEILNLEPNNFVILHPGSGGSTITWDINKFSELSLLLEKIGIQIVITGAYNEQQMGKIIQTYSPNLVNFIGRLTLSETIALISMAKGMVANSTGVLHIASVMEVPTVGVFPNTPHLSAKRWGPIGPYSAAVSPITPNPEDIDNLNLIQPEVVLNELLKQIKRKENELGNSLP
ncbi:MAG: glycosyltransferase family 9 protein [Candidatus Kapaibacteriales bacterium]